MRLKEGSRGTRREVQSGFGVRMELGGSWEEGSYQSMEMCFSNRQGRWRQQAEGRVGRLGLWEMVKKGIEAGVCG